MAFDLFLGNDCTAAGHCCAAVELFVHRVGCDLCSVVWRAMVRCYAIQYDAIHRVLKKMEHV